MPGLDTLLEQRGTELLAQLADEGVVKDAAIDAAADFWRVRDAVPAAFTAHGVPLPFDVAFTRTRLAPFIEALKLWMAHAHPCLTLHAFGHFGDGGAHLILVIPNDELMRYGAARCALLRSQVYRMVREHGGSFSAEHGIGPVNLAHYRQFSSDSRRVFARRLQAMFDPYGVVGRCRYD
jgi:D-lactate dehydrogenase (cytochrome)